MPAITVPGNLDALQAIGKLVMSAASEGGLDKKRSYALRLAVDEIATNIITHSYQESGQSGMLTAHADLDEQAITITLEDSGIAFDPTLHPPPKEEEFEKPLEERQMGGWGVYLAIQSVDKFLYHRVEDKNRNIFIMNRSVHGRLLLVDSQGERQAQFNRQLSELGYTVTPAENGEHALVLLGRQKYDLVLIERHAPGLDAIQFLHQLKADNAIRGIPVLVILDSSCEDEDSALCLVSGAEDFIAAPYHPRVMAARVAANLEKQRVKMVEAAMKNKEKLERDIQIGHQIQLSFLPDEIPQIPSYEIAARFEPAREVAGDFYDVFKLAHNRVGLVLGDVCDKGVGAALFMALFRSLIRAFAQQNYASNILDRLSEPAGAGRTPGDRRRSLPTVGTLALRNSIELTNNYIAINHEKTSMFATVFFGLLDPDTGNLLYINAGHEPPIILTAAGIKTSLRPTGPAVGMMPDMPFEIQQVQLEPGEMMLIYTDGVTDARNPQGQLFGYKRLEALLQQPGDSAAGLLGRLHDHLHGHIDTASQFDDITLLAVRRAPPVKG